LSRGWLRLTSRVEWQPDEIVDDASIADVLDAVARLDGGIHNELSVEWHERDQYGYGEDATTLMLVCGGDRVSVSHVVRDVTGDWDQNFAFLAQPERGDTSEEGVCGGQTIPFRARWWVDRSYAEQALRHFASRGGADPRLVWEHDPTFTAEAPLIE
jgi:hypothetical protein